MHGIGWGMGLMWIWWLIGLIVVIAFVWLVARAAAGGGGPRRDSAEQTLRERYAKGEIDRDEFDRRLSDLRR